ncbi:MAG: hypothetical protein LBN04_01320 [Oscillospiraceae bacterium]|jgi:hypothetical protein|nr:hypothetical protein [Oscillospiraceae bacterium]
MGTSWQKLYDENNRPKMSALNDFWNPNIRQLFVELSIQLHNQYGLALTHLMYTKSHGWTLKFTKSGVVLVKRVIVMDDSFYIDSILVADENSMQNALDYVASLYTPEFIEQFNEKIKKRNRKQVERSRRFAQRKKDELDAILSNINGDKLNQFHWSPRVPLAYLKRLYKDDAKMFFNDDLVDEVGYMLYARCLQGRDERLLANEGKLKCHHCGKILSKTNSPLLQCDCGYSYIFREYMRSFNENGMPSRSATPFFNEFVNKWPFAKEYREKMRLIDEVIHQCHLNMLSGVTRGFAGMNLFEGSKREINELILALAYN